MVDRYTRDALARYGELRRLNPAEALAELELFDDRLVIEGLPAGQSRPEDRERDSATSKPRLRFGVARRAFGLTPAVTEGHSRTSAHKPIPNGSDRTIRPWED